MGVIIVYCRRDKRAAHNQAVLMCCGSNHHSIPRWVITPKEYKQCSNKDDFVGLDLETIKMRGEYQWFKNAGFIK